MMQIQRLSPDKYAQLYTHQHVFNSVEFTELNRIKAQELHYLSIHDTKHRFGIILGERNGVLRSPFRLHSEVLQLMESKQSSVWRKLLTYYLHMRKTINAACHNTTTAHLR